MNLKEKEIYMNRNESISKLKLGESYYLAKDVNEAVLEFNKFSVSYAPYKPKCDSCGKGFVLIFKRDKFVAKNYQYCKTCLVNKIFGVSEQ